MRRPKPKRESMVRRVGHGKGVRVTHRAPGQAERGTVRKGPGRRKVTVISK